MDHYGRVKLSTVECQTSNLSNFNEFHKILLSNWKMSPTYENSIEHPQLTVNCSRLHYKRISGRLQRIESFSTSILPQVVINEFSKGSQCRYYSYSIGGLIAILICTFLVYAIFPYPLYASCTVKWKFREPCNHVIQRIRWQILKWSSYYNCGPRRSRCLFSLKESMNNNSIRASHISPNFLLSDNIKITFAEETGKSCIATGESKSNQWFVIFDYGSNYCNLRNLVEGANFVTDHGFMELTTNSICTQLDTAVCT